METFNVEVDAMPGGFVCSASFKGVADNTAIREAASGDLPIRKLFSKQQRAFYEAHAPDGVELDTLSTLGPIPIIKVKITPQGFGRKLVGELWMYPDGSQIVELSTKRSLRGVPGGSGGEGVPAEPWRGPHERATDEDQDRARVLLECDGRGDDMTIGPVQLLVLGFDKPDFRGEIIEEFERLRENDTVRVIDALVVFKDAEGDVAVLKGSQLSKDEAEEFGAVVGGLLGLGAGGEEGMEAGAIAARRPRRTASTCSTRKSVGRPGRAALRCRGRAHPARASLGDRAARRDRARRRLHRRTLHQSPRSDRDRPDLRGRGRGARRVRLRSPMLTKEERA